MMHLSTAYVFEGDKLAYNENDETMPRGLRRIGAQRRAGCSPACRASDYPAGMAVRKMERGLIKSWIRTAIKNQGVVQVTKRRDPTYAGDLASAILAMASKLTAAPVYGVLTTTAGLRVKEIEFAEVALKYAANYDEAIYRYWTR